MKPVELVARPVRNSSEKGDSVFDPFLGSGTTMVAAEQTQRVCYGIEIDRRFVAVTLQRMQDMGLKAKLGGPDMANRTTPGDLKLADSGKEKCRREPTKSSWPKGCSGNPAGGSVRFLLGKLCREKLRSPIEGDPLGRNWGQFVVDKLVERSAMGGEMATRTLFYYVEGPPRQIFEHQGSESSEMTSELRNEILQKLLAFLARGDAAEPVTVGARDISAGAAAGTTAGDPLRLAGNVGAPGAVTNPSGTGTLR
jgi:hypothetical protein